MHIGIEHHGDQFNVTLSRAPDRAPFLTIRGCRVVDGSKGRFISWPARKLDNGKYWNHVYASEGFAAHVLKAYDESERKQHKRDAGDDDDVPF